MSSARLKRGGAALAAWVGLSGCGEGLGSDDAGEPTAQRDEATGAADAAVAEDAAQAEFYGLERRVEIEVELDPAAWGALRLEGRSLIDAILEPNIEHNYTYFSADVIIDGQRHEDVAVRKKGYLASLSSERPSLKIHLGRDGRNLSHVGLDELTLSNDRLDPSHTNQCLAYRVFAAAGVPASRCGLAHVVVNGEDLGTYSNVEQIGKPLLARYFSDKDGNLYEGQLLDFDTDRLDLFQLETNETRNDRSDLARLKAALGSDDAEFVERLGAVLDLEAFRSFWALETLLRHWDGYAGNRNNFYVYHDPTSDRFVFLPWDTDRTFRGVNPFDAVNTSIAVYARGVIANRLYALPDQRQAFRERLGELAESAWVEERMNAELAQIEAIAVDAAPELIAAQRALVASHPVALREELSREAPEWIDAAAPPPDACAGAREVRGTFATTWGTLASPTEGAVWVEANIDGQPQQLTGTAGAGLDETLGDGIPRLRLSARLSPARTLGVDIVLTPRAFGPGATTFHGLETVGFVNVFDSGTAPLAGPLPSGILSDGVIEFDAAGTEPGAAVRGRFSGRLLQLGCFVR